MSSSRAARSSRTKLKGSPRKEVSSGRTVPPVIPEVVIGRLAGFTEDGAPLVDFPGNPFREPLPALSTARADASTVGRDVALLFADGDVTQPVLIGLIQSSAKENIRLAKTFDGDEREKSEAGLDSERMVLTAEREITLKCGKASLTLTRAGKVLIRGVYLVSRSSGVNRIKGGSVQIN